MPPETLEAPAQPNPSEQHRIEMPDGVVLSGMGGDVDAITESFEQRHEELHPEPAAAEPVAPVTATPAEPVDKPRTRGQKRFDQLTAERETEKRRADAAEARAKELEAKLTAPVPQPVAVVEPPNAPVVAERAKPQESEVGTKYPSYADFVEDLSDWKSEQKIAALRTELDARTGARIEAVQASRTRSDYVNTKVFPAGRTVYPDFDAVLQSALERKQMVPFAAQEAILKLPNPEHAIYALAKDDAKVADIVKVIHDPVMLGIAISQLMPRESVASPASTAPVVRTTNAPAPPQPVGAGTRTTSPSVEEAALVSQEAYRRARGLKAVR